MPARFTTLEHQIEQGLDTVKPDAAAKQIEYWEGQLKDADFRGAKTILHDLEALKKALHGDKPDGAAIQKLVAKLGAETVRSASNAEGAAAEKLKTVGAALEKAGG